MFYGPFWTFWTSYWPDESTDMQYDPFRSSRDLGMTWPEVKLWPWPFKVILYMVRRALTRQTRWYQISCSTFKIKDFIVEKPFWLILEFWPLVTSILTWVQKYFKWFQNYFSPAFERFLSFFSTATRSRDHGGFKRHPPPSRRWKIQWPSRARVKCVCAEEGAWDIISQKKGFLSIVFELFIVYCHITPIKSTG